MDDFDKKELGRLKAFETAVKRAVNTLDYAIQWAWAITIIGLPLIIYLAPPREDRTIQAVLMFLVGLMFLALAKSDKAVGRISEK